MSKPEDIVREAALSKTCHEPDPKIAMSVGSPLDGCAICKHCGCIYVVAVPSVFLDDWEKYPRRECAVRIARHR